MVDFVRGDIGAVGRDMPAMQRAVAANAVAGDILLNEPGLRRRGPAAIERQLALARLASGLAQPRGWPALLCDLAHVRDVIFERNDPLPALAQLCAALTFAAIGRRKRIGLVAAMTDDIEWNGEL